MKSSLALLFAFSSTLLFSQKAVEKMTKNTCECASKFNFETMSQKQAEMQLGMCLFKAYEKNKDDYKKEFGKYLTLDSPDFEKLGEMIGMEMVSQCPNTIMQIGLKGGFDDYEDAENAHYEAEGVITSVDKNQFYTISLKTKENTTLKFLLLDRINNTDFLLNPAQWKDQTVIISHVKKEFFDPRIDEYSTFNVISDLTIYE